MSSTLFESICLEFNVGLTLYTMTVLNGNIAGHVPYEISVMAVDTKRKELTFCRSNKT